jgi:ribonucleoside-triphosphate reductase
LGRFLKRDGLCTFFIVKGYQNLIIVQINRIDELQHVVYAVNQPAAARGYQSVFWNISLYDTEYFESMFGDFVFPDMDKPNYDSLFNLQKFFMKWFNKERENAVLTFPVVTAAMLTKDKKVYDDKFAEFCSEELSQGNSFFIYQSESADSLASCFQKRRLWGIVTC